MRINFNKIEILHFMSFDNEVFDFTNQDGMNLVTGRNFDIPEAKNGAGKTNVFQALLFGLYGQLPNKLTTLRISNRNIDDKEVRIVVYLDIDGIKYKVISGLNKRTQGFFNVFIFKDENWQDITKSTISESRQFFENEILHCDISLFLRTILLTSEQNYNFFNLKKQDKKEFIEKLFDISVFGDMYDSIHKDILLFDKEIISHQNQLVVLSKNEENYNQKNIQFIDNKESKENDLKTKIQIVQKQLDDLMSKTINKNNELIDKCNDALKKINNTISDLSMKKSDKSNFICNIKKEITIIKHQISEKQNNIDKHSELMEKLCIDCKKIFSDYYNIELSNNEIHKLNEDIENKTNQILKHSSEINIIDKSIFDLNNKIQKINEKLNDLTFEYDKANSNKNSITNQLLTLNANLKTLNESVNPYTELIENNKKLLINETEQLNDLSHKYKYLKHAEEIVNHESLKKFIIKDLIGIINNRIRYYLSKMGSKYTCIFDENLDYRFITDSGECELYNFSCGEKKRLEIATCLSFRDFISQRSNISSNILILDEYIDSGIDSLAVESILNIFKEFTIQDKQNIFVISHRAEVNDSLFKHIIEVQKKNGISHITYVQ